MRRRLRSSLALVGALGDGSILKATRDTLLSAFGGLAIGAGIGLALGIAARRRALRSIG